MNTYLNSDLLLMHDKAYKQENERYIEEEEEEEENKKKRHRCTIP